MSPRRQHHLSQPRRGLLLACVLVGLGGCNLLTGVSRLEVDDRAAGAGTGGEGLGGAETGGAPSNSGGQGGASSGGASGGAFNPLGGFGGEIPTDCEADLDCIHPEGCLLGDCQEGKCFFTVVECVDDRVCVDGDCLCPGGSVDCDGECLSGVCCPGETDGGCTNCGIRECKADRSGFECTNQGECSAGETCALLGTWSDGSSCGCALLETATCSDQCEKGPCL